MAVRTSFSTMEGANSPADWAETIASLPPGERVALVDRDDLRSLPAAVAAWGRERIAVGVTVRLGDPEDPLADVLLLAPTEEAYRHLCQFLSWRQEAGEACDAWWCDAGKPPDLGGLLAIVCHRSGIYRLRAARAEVWWNAEAGCLAPDGVPALILPVFTHHAVIDHTADPIRQAVASRSGRITGRGRSLADLADIAAASSELLDAGRRLLARCVYVPGGTWHMPPSTYVDADAELRQRSEAGARKRYARITKEIRARLDHELQVISSKGFSGYILTVADLAAGRRTCGRGSGASSLVCYCLGITNVDPVKYRLMFERFLNTYRTDPPDLDVDFPWDERDAVLASALKSYGREHVAMVATHQYLRRWSALRVVARAFGMADEVTSDIRVRIKAHERYGCPLRLPEPWPSIVESASYLVGTPFHIGLHCGGIVITPTPIRDLVPIHPAAKRIAYEEPDDGDDLASPLRFDCHDDEAPPTTIRLPAIAWEKDGAEAMGLVKIDLLGNRALAVVRDAIADLAEDGVTIDEARWRPAEDLTTKRLVASGDTMGCFYIESPAMRQLQAKAGSGDFDRLVIHSSIIRPAANRWINEYLKRLHHHRTTGRHQDEWYPHPCLRGLLSESFGILSYQEDVMLSAQEIAGFDERQANGLRKALGHWDTQTRLTRFAEEFRRGAEARGITDKAIDTVWGMISSFAGYSFCKAHSASYAMVSFQCAYLKAHHPAYFLARVIANEGGFYTPAAYLEDARRLGIAILGPCFVASSWLTKRESSEAIRCGLHLLPGFSRTSGERVIAERARRPFTGIADLRRRCRLSSTQLDTLARAGALDALAPGRNRVQVRWIAQQVGLERHGPRSEEDDDGMVQRIFPVAEPVDPTPPPLEPRSTRAEAWDRWKILGFLPEGHPIWFFSRAKPRLNCRNLTVGKAGSTVTVTAWSITRKQVECPATIRLAGQRQLDWPVLPLPGMPPPA